MKRETHLDRTDRAIREKDWAWLREDGAIVECPICGREESDGNVELAERFAIPLGIHGAQVDNVCGACDVSYMPEDSPYAAEVYTHIPWDEMDDRELA